MSHQSGIQATTDLLGVFASAKSGNTRCVQVEIENESMVLRKATQVKDSIWDKDFDATVLPLLRRGEPSYVLYRLDSQNEQGYEWLLINWVPDDSKVRHKMLYASTRATLRKQFGDNFITEELSASTKEDASLSGYYKHLQSKAAPPPLTQAEEELADMRSNIDSSTGLAFFKQTVSSVAFPLTNDSVAAIKRFAGGACDYVQIAIDIPTETLSVTHCCDRVYPQQLANLSPEDDGRYHLYRFRHIFADEEVAPTLFIHSISGYKGTIKSRMLYSSCKSALLNSLEHDFGIHFDHRMETDNISELTAESLAETCHPKPAEPKHTFEKPKGPSGRGPRRIIKGTSTSF